jgi:hypothetical protein
MAQLVNFPRSEGMRGAQGVRVAASDMTGDWTQQEIADLYRVEALLIQANMRIETERGTTDEGEPWFVFCRPDGEVFVHLCRIEGEYLLDSPGLDAPLRGSDFAALIALFIRGVAARAATGNVVQFRKAKQGDVVRLHPALMMAALIWSLYLASDHLMEAAQAAEMDLADGIAPFPLRDAEVVAAEMDALLAEIDASTDLPQGAVGVVADRGPVHGRSQDEGRGWTASQGIAASITGALTAIAVTYGLHEQRKIDIDLVANTPADGTGEASHSGASALDIIVAQGQAHQSYARGDEPLSLTTDRLVEIDAVPVLLTNNAVLGTVQSALNELGDMGWLSFDMSASSGGAITPPAAEPVRIETLIAASPAVTTTKAASTPPVARASSDTAALMTLAEKHLGSAANYQIEGKAIIATFNLAEFKFAGTEVISGTDLVMIDPSRFSLIPTGIGSQSDSEPTAPQVVEVGHIELPAPVDPILSTGVSSLGKNTGLAIYDSFAKSFIQSFLTKSDSVEMIKLDNALVLVDMTAVDDVHDRYVSKSWIVDDSLVVTAIGHYQDFVHSGLLFI